MKKIILLLFMPLMLFAEQSQIEIPKTESELPESKVKNEGVDQADQLITNRRFRASNGSLSPISMNMQINYNAGSLEDPLSATRPNIANAGDTALISGIVGTVSGTYRLSDLHRLNLGVGVQMLAPFHSTSGSDDPSINQEFDANAGEFDASNPILSHTYMNKFFGVQTIFTTGFRQYTAGNLTDAGYNNAVEFTANTMYEVKDTGFSFGLLFVGTRNFFNDDNPNFLGRQNETIFGFLPQAEYIINDTFNLRTIVRSHWYQNNRLGDTSDYTKRPVTQSVGLGISVNRDIFLYPNVQFAYDEFSLENTNVGFQASMNLF